MQNNRKINKLLKLRTEFKTTHNIQLAEVLSPITEKLDEVKETTQKLEVNEKSQTENSIPQPAVEHTPHHQGMEKMRV